MKLQWWASDRKSGLQAAAIKALSSAITQDPSPSHPCPYTYPQPEPYLAGIQFLSIKENRRRRKAWL